MASGVTLCSLKIKVKRKSIAHFDTQECLWGHSFFHYYYFSSASTTQCVLWQWFSYFFFDQGCYWCWSSCKMVLHILDDLKRFLYNSPKTTIMSWQMTFYCLQWPHILPISQSALFCPLHQSVLPPSRGLKTNCQFQTICVTSTQRNKLKHEL